jgi:predicted CXXCH cytochrome family protein
VTLLFLSLLAASLAGAFPEAQAAPAPFVLYPPDLTLSSRPVIPLYAVRKEGKAPVRVTVNGKPTGAMTGATVLKGEAPLTPGLNRLTIGGKAVRVYYRGDSSGERVAIQRGKGNPPLVFRSYYLHPAMEEGCGSCHVEEGGKLGRKDQKTACYGCHDDFGKGGKPGVFLHGPVAAGECASCHDPHFSARPKLQKSGKGCMECHDAPTGKRIVHAPVRSGQCTGCHDPHAGVAPNQLVRNGNALCTKCHEAFHGMHRSATVVGTITKLPRDVLRDGHDLSCLACHFPHQSANDRLLVKSAPELCHGCHRFR